ncbi:MAG: hypothetical protein ACXWWX_04900 [Actinomycetota bacterium]
MGTIAMQLQVAPPTAMLDRIVPRLQFAMEALITDLVAAGGPIVLYVGPADASDEESA